MISSSLLARAKELETATYCTQQESQHGGVRNVYETGVLMPVDLRDALASALEAAEQERDEAREALNMRSVVQCGTLPELLALLAQCRKEDGTLLPVGYVDGRGDYRYLSESTLFAEVEREQAIRRTLREQMIELSNAYENDSPALSPEIRTSYVHAIAMLVGRLDRLAAPSPAEEEK